MDLGKCKQWRDFPQGRRHTSQVATKHEVKHEETILIILESITQIDYEWVVDLPSKIRGCTNSMSVATDVPPPKASAPEEHLQQLFVVYIAPCQYT